MGIQCREEAKCQFTATNTLAGFLVDRNAADSVRDHPQMMSAPSISLDIKKTAAFVIIDTDTYTLYPRWPMIPIETHSYFKVNCVQGPRKKYANLAKQDPSMARQNS